MQLTLPSPFLLLLSPPWPLRRSFRPEGDGGWGVWGSARSRRCRRCRHLWSGRRTATGQPWNHLWGRCHGNGHSIGGYFGVVESDAEEGCCSSCPTSMQIRTNMSRAQPNWPHSWQLCPTTATTTTFSGSFSFSLSLFLSFFLSFFFVLFWNGCCCCCCCCCHPLLHSTTFHQSLLPPLALFLAVAAVNEGPPSCHLAAARGNHRWINTPNRNNNNNNY